VNSVHSTGYNMNGTTAINFFTNLTQNFAMAMDISDEVRTDVMNIAVTSSVSNPSNNDIALSIADLGVGSVTISGQNMTYVDFTTSASSRIGSLSQNAQNLTEYHQNLMTSVEKQRDSISGVSIDEELSNLIKYQYAYQAAARLINAADTLMNSLLEIAR
jgi:flagellar hook-associated protein 1 FlgK